MSKDLGVLTEKSVYSNISRCPSLVCILHCVFSFSSFFELLKMARKLHNDNSLPSTLELLKIEMVALTGKAMEGEMLTAVEVIPNSESQQKVWSKYKKDVKYHW